MTLPLPKLDSRRYDDLVAEALRRVPRYTPEWTNHNDSDPGKALIGVNAWLTETLLYQINRVPDQNYVAFLNLLGITPRPAKSAVAELAFQLKPLSLPTDPLQVILPAATRVAVDDPDLDTEVVFETGGSAYALNAAFGQVLVPDDVTDGVWKPVTSFDTKAGAVTWLHAFDPFGAPETVGRQFIFALVLRPVIKGEYEDFSEDRLPSGALDLYVEATQVFDTDPSGAVISGPLTQVTGPVGTAPDAPQAIRWEIFTGSEARLLEFDGADGWQSLGVSLDETAGLIRSGHLTFDVPANATPVRFGDLGTATWAALNLRKPPQTADELVAALRLDEDRLGENLRAALNEAAWGLMGVPADVFNDVLGVCATADEVADKVAAWVNPATPPADQIPVNPAAITTADWAEILPDEFAGPEVLTAENAAGQKLYRRMYYIRATLLDAAEPPRMLNTLRLNTVRAVAASTRQDEKLGVSNGRPGQIFTLTRSPVYFDPLTQTPDLDLDVIDGSDDPRWQRVDDFYGFGPDAKVYILDPITGTLTFGDGRANGRGGAIPPPNATIRAARYRYGGGTLANVGAGSISKIKGSLRGVDSVANPRAASGGDDAETFDEVLGRAPSTLRSRDRAVSAQDFADLAKQTPAAAIHKAYALGAQAVTPTGFAPRPGAVSVVVLPARDEPTPQPTEAELRAVQCWLEPRRLVTTEIYVTGPRYFTITGLSAQLRLIPQADFQTVSTAARAALTDWLHPIRGGPDGTGWPFGTDIFLGDLYDHLLAVSGVRRVARLSVTLPGGVTPPDDIIVVPDGHLPALADGAINFEVIYDTA
jgi:hypothetical protein